MERFPSTKESKRVSLINDYMIFVGGNSFQKINYLERILHLALITWCRRRRTVLLVAYPGPLFANLDFPRDYCWWICVSSPVRLKTATYFHFFFGGRFFSLFFFSLFFPLFGGFSLGGLRPYTSWNSSKSYSMFRSSTRIYRGFSIN